MAIVGVWDFYKGYSALWRNFEKAFSGKFPECTFSIEKIFYSPWEIEKIRTFADAIVRRHDKEGVELILLGYSMGGVIASAIAPRFKDAKVLRIVTVFAPHTFLRGWFSKKLGSSLLEPPARTLSFQARFDYMVPWGAKHPYADWHVAVTSDHLVWLLASERVARQVAAATRRSIMDENTST